LKCANEPRVFAQKRLCEMDDLHSIV
jgi:hypothetical protein